MKPELAQNILGLGSPQNSRRKGMQTNLIEIPEYAQIIDQADKSLDLPAHGSLDEELQTSGVTHTLAVHSALEAVTGRKPRIWTAPSIGENVVAVRTGAVPMDYMLRGLAIRQRITDHPIAEGFKTMVAVSGADPDDLTQRLEEVKSFFDNKVKAAISNINGPRELVISISLPEGLAVPDFIKQLKQTGSEHFENFKASWLKRITNAFHSQEIAYEQVLFAKELELELGEGQFNTPDENVDWFSPMKLSWIKTAEQVKDLFIHQLTPVVNFRQAIQEIMASSQLTAAISADPLGIVNGMFERNLNPNGPRPEIINVTDRASFDLAANLLLR